MAQFKSTSIADTHALGNKVGRVLNAGDSLMLVANLGTGKTTFVQGVAQGLGVKNFTTSPTFIIAQTFEGRVPLHHLDFYRVSKQELLDIGVQDYFSGLGIVPAGVVAIEWADLFKEVWPVDHLEVHIKMDVKSGTRTFDFKASGKKSTAALAKLTHVQK
jgi:tRNA threonylcarbamoyladenosine biosynthesis protein TsaE